MPFYLIVLLFIDAIILDYISCCFEMKGIGLVVYGNIYENNGLH